MATMRGATSSVRSLSIGPPNLELMRPLSTVALDPPMPVYLYNQVAGLRERNAKGYPVKKVRPTRSSQSFMLQLTYLYTDSSCFCCGSRCSAPSAG